MWDFMIIKEVSILNNRSAMISQLILDNAREQSMFCMTLWKGSSLSFYAGQW